ncbi:MAG: hypothetical protein V1797_18920 [Pseudomonadota bacterium]
MAQSAPRHRVVYFSVGGSTAKVAGWIREELEARGQAVEMVDITLAAEAHAAPAPDSACLWLLSPVYAMHPAPPVCEFLRTLDPAPAGCAAVPVATYGVVCSGVVLSEMGGQLVEKGYRLAGAAKVVCQHSMLWYSPTPLGQGRPDQDDEAVVRALAGRVAAKLASAEAWTALDLTALNYQPPQIQALAPTRNVSLLRSLFPPMRLEPESCDECGLCAESCFTHSITMDPKPIFGPECLYCLNCARICPNQAISNPILAGLEQELRSRAETFGEPAVTLPF